MIINDYIVDTGGILFDVWYIMNLPKKAYTLYNTYTQAAEYIDIINKYAYKYIYWLSITLKSLNQQWNQLSIFLTTIDRINTLCITSKLGSTISKSTYYRHRTNTLTKLPKSNIYLCNNNYNIIWVDNFSRILKHSKLNVMNYQPFSLNLWSVLATMTPKFEFKHISGDYNIPAILPFGLLSEYEKSLHMSITASEYYTTSLTYELSITAVPIKAHVSFERLVMLYIIMIINDFVKHIIVFKAYHTCNL